MKFLIDNAVSPFIREGLCVNGYDAIHVKDIMMANASDIEVFNKAGEENRIIVSCDTDFLIYLRAKLPINLLSFCFVRIQQEFHKDSYRYY